MFKTRQTKESFTGGDIIIGGGEMGDHIRKFDWSATNCGKISDWPEYLISAVNLILQSSAPLMILWGQEGITIYNEAYSKLAGKRHPKLLGKSFGQCWPELSDFTENVLDKCLQGEAVSFKRHPLKVYRNSKPEDIYIDLSCSPILDKSGIPKGTFVINFEITEQVKSEEALKKSEKGLWQIIDGSNDGIWDYDLKTKTAFWNDRMYEILGFKRDEVARPGFDFLLKYILPEEKERVMQAFHKTLADGIPFDIEYSLKNKSGEKIYLHAKGKPVYDSEGNITGIAGIAIDITKPKEAENALKESEARFSSIFDQTFVGIGQTDLYGNFTLVNDRFCEIVGRPKDELYRMKTQDITHPDDLSLNIKLLQRTASKGEPFSLEKRYIRPDKSIVWVDLNVSAVKDEKGKLLYILGVCQDITEFKKAEESILESEERFRAIAEASGILIANTDESGNIIYFNRQWSVLTGMAMDELKSIGLFNIIHPEERQNFKDDYFKALRKKEILTKEFRIEDQKGENVWVLGVLSPRFRRNGSFAGFIGSFVDITDRKSVEKALIESETRFRSMADSSPSLFWMMNEKGQMTYFNKTFKQYIGISEDYKGIIPWEKFIPEDELESLQNLVSYSFENRESIRTEHRIIRFDGSERWLLVTGQPRFTGRKFQGFIGSNVDITDRKLAEKALEVKNKQLIHINNDLDNFIYTASHDLKAPINNIEGLVNTLNQTFSESYKDNEEVFALTSMIYQSVERFKNTIKDLTDVAKVDSWGNEDLSETSFSEMLEEVKLNIQNKIEDSGAEIIGDFSQVPSIYFSKKNIRSVIYNLLSNAIKYRSPDRKPIVLISTSWYDKEHIMLKVQDNGLGIKKEDKAKVFMMFKRLHHHVEGTGIGLSIVKKIIDNNGGRIEIDSEEGKGTTFKIFFKV